MKEPGGEVRVETGMESTLKNKKKIKKKKQLEKKSIFKMSTLVTFLEHLECNTYHRYSDCSMPFGPGIT